MDPTDNNFIRSQVIDEKLEKPKFRFPPEPNGFLHLGHAKAICLSYGLADEFNGECHLRFDDTNPSAENEDYIRSIQRDIRWLGWLKDGDKVYYTSDNFELLYQWACRLIENGLAYVCDLGPEEMREYRGNIHEVGKPCTRRELPPENHLDLFKRMRAGEFPESSLTLRAKIDLTSFNMNLRDPVMYRIMKKSHHQTGDKWCIYPAYDWAHGECDVIEGIDYSLCTIEYESHRPLYDWFLDQLEKLGELEKDGVEVNNGRKRPRQIEFAPLTITHTVLSKRKLKRLIDDGLVSGWDDPRMPTLSGLRRRGVRSEAIRQFCVDVGVTKANSMISLSVLDKCVRDDLNANASRRMVVTRPLKLVIENYPEDLVEEMDAQNHPEHPDWGTRKVPFTRELWIEQEDFREEAPRKYFRMKPGQEVRLRYAYYVTCTGFDKDPETGEVVCVRATYDPVTRGGNDPGGRKVKGTIHWVSAKFSRRAELRVFKPLFTDPNPETGFVMRKTDWIDTYDPESLEILPNARLERAILNEVGPAYTKAEVVFYQFERQGYYCLDLYESDATREDWVFNLTVTLKDSWAKIEKK